MRIQWDLLHTDKLYSQAHQVPASFAFLGKWNLFFKCTKQVTIATELREEMFLVRCQSFIFGVGTSQNVLGTGPDDWYSHISILWQKDWQDGRTKDTGGGKRRQTNTLGGEADCH